MKKTIQFAIVAAAITTLGGTAFAAAPTANAATATHPAKAPVAQAVGAKQDHTGKATKAGMEHGKTAGENDAMAINQAKVSIGRAISAAEKAHGGRATKAELEHSKQGLIYEVEVVAGVKVFDVTVDAEKGCVSSSTEDSPSTSGSSANRTRASPSPNWI